MQLGAKVVTLSDSTGWIYDPDGIDLEAVKEIKEVKRLRLSEYVAYRPNSQYTEGGNVWSVPCDVALPVPLRTSWIWMTPRLSWPTAALP